MTFPYSFLRSKEHTEYLSSKKWAELQDNPVILVRSNDGRQFIGKAADTDRNPTFTDNSLLVVEVYEISFFPTPRGLQPTLMPPSLIEKDYMPGMIFHCSNGNKLYLVEHMTPDHPLEDLYNARKSSLLTAKGIQL